MFKKTLLVNLVAVSIGASTLVGVANAAAFTPSLYAGLQAGYGITQQDAHLRTLTNDTASSHNGVTRISQNHLAGRVFVGYEFMPYFALETGYLVAPKNSYASIDNVTSENTVTITQEVRSIDLVGKGTLPLSELSAALKGWNVYGKFGFAYETVRYTAGAFSSSNNGVNEVSSARPTYGLGVGYDATKRVSIDASWNSINGKGNLNKVTSFNTSVQNFDALPTVHLFSLGVIYKFSAV